MSQWLKTIVFLIVAAFLTHFIPFSSFFRNVDTLIHETGHAVMTWALSGHVLSIQLHPDHSGVTYSTLSKRWSVIPITLAGYMSASLFALYLFYSNSRGNQKQGLIIVTLIAAISLLFFVRNSFGMTWILGFIIINVVMIGLVGSSIRNFYYMLLAFLSLVESVFGPVTLFIHSLTSPNQVGDATNLGYATIIPTQLWTFWFALFSLWCAMRAMNLFLGKKQKHVFKYKRRSM